MKPDVVDSAAPRRTFRRIAVIPAASGCFRGMMDVQDFKQYVGANDAALTDDPADADLIVFFSCGYVEHEERFTLDLVRDHRRRFPHTPIVVSGCMPHINAAPFEAIGEVTCIGIRELERFDEYLGARRPIAEIPDSHFLVMDNYAHVRLPRRVANFLIPLGLKVFRPFASRWPQPLYHMLSFSTHGPDTYFVKTSEGCLGNCSFCVVRRARGKHRSQPFDRVVGDVRRAVESGYRKIWLLCDDLGPYGTDLGTDAAALLRAIVDIPGDFHVVVSYFGPSYFLAQYERLRPVLATGKIASLMIPIQTGSPRILERMYRRYDIDQVVARLREVRRDFPTTILKTCLIVGFPGEEEDDFEKSVRILDAVDYAAALPFSPRPGTPAAEMTPVVPAEVARRRHRRLIRLQLMKVLGFVVSSLLRPKPPGAPFGRRHD